MKGRYLLAGGGVITAVLASWLAMASAQSPPSDRGVSPPPGVVPARTTDELPLPPALPALGTEGPVGSTPPPGPSTQDLPAPMVPGEKKDVPARAPLEPSDTSLPAECPIGKQEPAVSIEWAGPPVAKVGQVAEYSLIVRNAWSAPVHQVAVRARIPSGLTLHATKPQATGRPGGTLTWDLGTLSARQERVLTLSMQADARGDVTPQAWVTFTAGSAMRIMVRQPQLTVRCACPAKVLVGDPAQFTLTVHNPGDGAADGVKLKALLGEGLEHARGNIVPFEIGSLAAGESRTVTLLCGTRAGGPQKCDVVAEGEGKLSARGSATLNVLMPKLEVQLVGPGLRYLDRKAIYTLKVTNPGDAPATNVTVSDVIPVGFKVLAASDGGRHDYQTRMVSWFLGELAPGATREVRFEVQAVSPGEHVHKAAAAGARGLRATSELRTRVEGLSALSLEIYDTEDPIEVHGETAYEVRISNTGSKTETNIKLVATVPNAMQVKKVEGPVRFRQEGQVLHFEPIERLAPKADAIFRIHVKTLQPGTVRFNIQVTSTNLTEPVIKMEPTNIYSDAPDMPPSPKAGPPARLPMPPAETSKRDPLPPPLPGGR